VSDQAQKKSQNKQTELILFLNSLNLSKIKLNILYVGERLGNEFDGSVNVRYYSFLCSLF